MSLIIQKLGLAPIIRNLILLFEFNTSGKKKVNVQTTIRHEAIRCTAEFRSPCGKGFRQGCVHNLIRTFFIMLPFAVQKFHVFTDGSVEVVENVELMRIQSIRVVNLLIVDVHLDFGKKLKTKCSSHE